MSDTSHLVWCAPIDEPTGYADEARGLLTALEAMRLPVALRQAGVRDAAFRASLSAPMQQALTAQQQRGLARPLVVVQHFPADGFARAEGVDWQVGRTMFETDGLPASWVAQCNRLDELWVPSTFNVDTFRRAGVTVPITRVPGGVDVTHFSPHVSPMAIEGARGTLFLGVFEWSYRKGWDVLLRAWAEAFTRDDNVTLVLRTRIRSAARAAGHPEAGAQLDAFLCSALGCTRADLAPIVVLDAPLDDATLPMLYRRADALVSASRGEGWGRPLMEAMACGVPVITTRWSAPLDFLHDDNSLLVNVNGLVPARDDVFSVYDGQRWADPSSTHLVEQLRRVHAQPAEARLLGQRAREAMVAQWTWGHAAQVVGSRMQEIGQMLADGARAHTAPPTSNAREATPVVSPAVPVPSGSPAHEHHLFVLWETARSEEARIMADLASRFTIVHVTELRWTPDRVSENFTRFYGQALPPGSFKEEHCGTGPALAILVRDERPAYAERETSKGPRVVNTRTFDAKATYRSWTGGGHKVHATDTVDEARHDVALLFDAPINEIVDRHPAPWDGTIATREADLAGSNGWRDLVHLFAILNETTRYLVLRNFEALPHAFDPALHGDIDLLVASVPDFTWAANATPDANDPHGRHYIAVVGGAPLVLDPKAPGDGYYDERWQRDMLERRVRHVDGFDTPSEEDYFFSLLYHMLLHKPRIERVYVERLARNAMSMGLMDVTEAVLANPFAAKRLLDDFMRVQRYDCMRPREASVFYLAMLPEAIPMAPVELEVFARLPRLAASHTILSARTLAEVHGVPADSVVYDLGDRIVKQGTGELASHEARILSRLDGPLFPRVLDHRQHDGWSELTLERVDGESFTQLRPQLAASPARLAAFFADGLQLLDALRGAQIAHRDIHAGNVRIRNGRPVLLDFGWATAPRLDAPTPEWLNVDARPGDGVHCDTYSMGRLFAACVPAGDDRFAPLLAAMTHEEARQRVRNTTHLRALLMSVDSRGAWCECAAVPRDEALDALLAQADAWYAGGYATLAEDALRAALVLRPESVALRLALAVRAEADRDVDAERAWLEQAVDRDPWNTTVRRRAGRACLRDEDHLAAAEHARVRIEQQPDDADAWLQRAIALLQIPSRRSAADEALAKAGELAPAHPDVRALSRVLYPGAAPGPLVSIIIPVHGQVTFTASCLEALEATLPSHLAVEVIVVNDASLDSTAAYLDGAMRRWPWLRTVHLADNQGFAGACNAGAAAARGRWLHFLNNDTTPQPGWLEPMLAAVQADPSVGIVGSLLVFPPHAQEAPLRVQHVGIAFREDRTSTHLYKFCYADLPFVRRSRECQAVTGASLLVDRALFDDIGGFDTDYRNGGEDLELCFAARARGRRVVVAAESVIWHHESATLVFGHRASDANYLRFLTRWRDVIIPDEESLHDADGVGRQARPRVAMVTPLAPVRSGVSDVVRELAEVLRDEAQVDFLTADVVPTDSWITDSHHVYSAHDYGAVWDLRRPDVVFLHIGNNQFHARMAEIARHAPTVLVLHEYDVRGTGGSVSSRVHLQGLFRHAVAAVVHNAHSRDVLQEEFPSLPVHVVPLTVPPALLAMSTEETAERREARRRLGVPEDTFLIVSLGLVQYHKRNHVAVEAMAQIAARVPNARLVLAGEAPEVAYQTALERLAHERGVSNRVQLTGWTTDRDFLDWLAAADATVNLRFPARGEESASLARILASGRPACVSDYAQFADLPRDAVVHIPFEHEVRNLADALVELAESPACRARLGAAARAHVMVTGSPAQIASRYRDIIASASTVSDADRLLRSRGYAPAGAVPAAVLWQTAWDRVSDPCRHVILALDASGVPLSVARVEPAGVLPPPTDINASDRSRLLELERRPLEAEYVQCYAGPPSHWVRHDRARIAVAVLFDTPLDAYGQWAQRPVDEFWVPSQYAATHLAEHGVAPERIAVVPAGVPAVLYRTHVHENRPAGPVRLLAVTDWRDASGWEPLLRAWLRARREVPGLALTFRTSDGQDSEQARDLRFANALTNFMTRHTEYADDEYLDLRHDGRTVPEDLLPNAYALAHAVVCPAADAGGGRVALEAMALGLPVIVADHGVYREIAPVGHAIHVPMRRVAASHGVDEDVLVQTLIRLARERVATQAVGIVARQHVLAHRTWRQAAEQVHARLRRLAMRPEQSALASSRRAVTSS